MERGCPPGQLSAPPGRGLHVTPTTPYLFAWGMLQGLLKARGVETALAPERKVQAGPVKIRKVCGEKKTQKHSLEFLGSSLSEFGEILEADFPRAVTAVNLSHE